MIRRSKAEIATRITGLSSATISKRHYAAMPKVRENRQLHNLADEVLAIYEAV